MLIISGQRVQSTLAAFGGLVTYVTGVWLYRDE